MRTLVIAGISGDLARGKLLPALRVLARAGELPFERVLGASRRPLVLEDFLEEGDPLRDILVLRQMDVGDAAACAALARELGPGTHLFYLAVPPGSAPAIAAALGPVFGDSVLLLEKPFGFNTASAALEARHIDEQFPGRVFRVDHYLMKPLARAIVGQGKATRLEVLASEAAGAGGRTVFYERTGALRDFGNHLLSLVALALGGASPEERLHALKNLSVASARRAQYEGYRAEALTASETETFFALELSGASATVSLASGKGFAAKYTEVRVAGPGGVQTFADQGGGPYEQVLLAAARGDANSFLTMSEIMESWRLMDVAREQWGPLRAYPRGTRFEDFWRGADA